MLNLSTKNQTGGYESLYGEKIRMKQRTFNRLQIPVG